MINLAKKKILVTGAHGFLGRHLIKNLLEKRQVSKKNLFLPAVEELDLRKWKSCQRAVKNQDIVIHLAAVTGGIEFHRLNPAKIFYDNLIIGVQLMEAAYQERIEKFVVVGSAAEYPKNSLSPLKEDDLWNGYPDEIHAPYALAKKILLVQGQAYRQQYGFNAIHLLLTNVYGPGMDFGGKSYVMPAVMEKITDAQKTGCKFISVWGTGKPKRDFLYVEDAVEGILLASEKYNKPEPVNLGSGRELSIKALVGILCKSAGFQGEVRWDTSKPSGRMRRLLDISRAKKEFGFKAKTALEDGLFKTIKRHEAL